MAKSRKAKPEEFDLEKLSADDLPRLATNQKFVTMKLPRKALKNAPYNPRLITPKNKKKLKKGLEKVGLVAPITWNKRTGNIVGGHRRIEILDGMEGTEDYSLEVAVIDVDEKREKEINILLNNFEAQGEFDLGLLNDVFKEDLDIDATGFDMADIFQMFGENPAVANAEKIQEAAEKLQEIRDRHDVVKEILSNIEDSNYYNVILFSSYEKRLRFASALGLENNRYIDGESLADALGIDLNIPCEAETEGEADEQSEDEGGGVSSDSGSDDSSGKGRLPGGEREGSD